MKKIINYSVVLALLFTSTLLMSSCSEDDATDDVQPAMQAKSIVEIASADANFSILVEALSKANLVSALQMEGPFTVFAPTNTAFQELFNELGINGIDDLSAEALTPILLYHVVGASVKSSGLSSGYINTINTSTPDGIGLSMLVSLGNNVMLNENATVTMADIEASNGIIHVIDKVLLPPGVVDIAIANPNFSILVEAVIKADLVNALSADGPFTIFAPTNDAFMSLFSDLGVSGIADLSAEALTPILLYHVVNGNVNSMEVTSGMVPTLNESAGLDLMVLQSGVSINGNSNVIAVDVQGTNGIIHVIDKVLLP